MGHKVLQFPTLAEPAPKNEDLKRRVRELADSSNILWPTDMTPLLAKGITDQHILTVLRQGALVGSLKPHPTGNWQIKLKRLVAAKRLLVTVIVWDGKVLIIKVS